MKIYLKQKILLKPKRLWNTSIMFLKDTYGECQKGY